MKKESASGFLWKTRCVFVMPEKRWGIVNAGGELVQGENYEFDVDIRKIPDLDGAYVEIPFDVKAAFGRRHVKVHATFDGVAYDGQIVRWGMPRPILRVRKEIRKQIRKQPGDLVHVTITARQDPRK